MFILPSISKSPYNPDIAVNVDLWSSTPNFTIEFMMKVLKQGLIWGNSSWERNYGMTAFCCRDNILAWGLQIGWGAVTCKAPFPFIGEWKHIALRAVDDLQEIYIDGVCAGSIMYHKDNSWYPPPAPPHLLYCSSSGWWTADACNQGAGQQYIDELRVWSPSLSPEEIHAKQRKIIHAPYPSNLVNYYKFDEGIGVYDTVPVIGSHYTNKVTLVGDTPDYLRSLALIRENGMFKYYDSTWKEL